MSKKDSRQLVGLCEFGYLDLEGKGQVVGGKWANQTVQPNSSKLIPAQFSNVPSSDSDGYISPKLSSVAEHGSAILPFANPNIGAPQCTFAYGGIMPGASHPYFQLLSAPTQYTYITGEDSSKWIASERGGIIGTSTPEIEDTSLPSFLNNSSLTPIIPVNSITDGYNTSDAPILPTYNIWMLLNGMNDKSVQYQQNLGRTNFSSEHVALRQEPAKDSMYLVLASYNNQKCVIERLYPLSQDTMYSAGCKLYNPKTDNKDTPASVIGLQPTNNCGFQLSFDVSSTSNAGSEIVVVWGDYNGLAAQGLSNAYSSSVSNSAGNIKRGNISLYRLTIQSGEMILEYVHPASQKWSTPIKLKGKFQNENFKVYVHYAGPIMLIGFSEDPSEWNVISPVEDAQDNREYFHVISAEACINVSVTNMVAKFQYAPIAFNNFNPEQVARSEDAKSNIKCTMSVQSQASIDQMKEYFKTSKMYNLTHEEQQKFDGGTTYYPDWRVNFNTDSIVINTGAFDSKNKIVDAQIKFDTTVEGPMFFSVYNTPDESKDDDSIIKKIDVGDATEYLISWKIKNSLACKNKSFLESEATIVLKNLALTEQGRSLLTLLEENILAVKLGGGFKAKPEIFFEGIVERCETEYSKDGSTTTVTCKDLASGILSQIVFPQQYSFESNRYLKVIETCLMISGLYNWYDAPVVTGDTKWEQVLNIRLGTLVTGLDKNPLRGNPLINLQQVINRILELMIHLETIPVLYWNPKKERIVLEKRSKKAICDDLLFLGKIEENVTEIPKNIHGVLTENYTITTYNKGLHTGISLFSINYLGQPLPYKKTYTSENPQSSSEAPSSEKAGWVGFRKIYAEDVTETFIKQYPELKQYGDDFSKSFLMIPYQSITFDVYVSKPLHHYGKFKITTFMSNSNATTESTDAYFYSTVDYDFSKEQNTIKAKIAGENAPSAIYRGF